MAQTFSALQSGVTTFGELYGVINNNIEAIRTQWSGASAPGSPAIGQPFYNTSNGRINVWTGTEWVDIANTSTEILTLTAEIAAARGSASSLDVRLSVALNEDGTLKSGAPAGTWWMNEPDTVSFVDATSFTVVGDKTAIYTVDRAIHLIQNSEDYGYVVSSSYDGGGDITTVVVTEAAVDSGLIGVEYGQPPLSSPNRLKEEDIGVTVQGYDADTAKYGTAQEWTAAQTYADDTLAISSGSIAWDMQDKPKAEVSLTEDVTAWTVTNAGPGELWLTQDATGGRTVAWPSSWLWPGGVAGSVTTDADATDVLTLTERGGTLYATLTNDFKVVS